MAEFFPDSQTELERVLLWQGVVDTFREQSYVAGMQALTDPDFVNSEYAAEYPTNLVLVSQRGSGEPLDIENATIHLWGTLAADGGVADALLTVKSPGIHLPDAAFELSPEHIKDYSAYDKKPFDSDRLQDIRACIEEATWDPEASEKIARTHLRFSSR